jgi:hypothetical protein
MAASRPIDSPEKSPLASFHEATQDRISDDMLKQLLVRLQQLQKLSAEPKLVQENVDAVQDTLRTRQLRQKSGPRTTRWGTSHSPSPSPEPDVAVGPLKGRSPTVVGQLRAAR